MATPTGVTVGGIDAEIFASGFGAANSLDSGPERWIIYKVPWSQAVDFVDALLGIFRRSPSAGGPVTYIQPHVYPGGNPGIVCHSARMLPPEGDARPDPARLVAASFALVSAEYRRHVFNPFPDAQNSFPGPITPWSKDSCRGYTQSYSIAADFLVDQFDATYSPSGNVEIFVPHVEFIRHRVFVPYVFLNNLALLAGHVNNAIFFGMATGTIKFDHWDMDGDAAPDGGQSQSYILTFVWRPMDWNALLRDDKVQWDIHADAGTNYVYPYSDLTPLLA